MTQARFRALGVNLGAALAGLFIVYIFLAFGSLRALTTTVPLFLLVGTIGAIDSKRVLESRWLDLKHARGTLDDLSAVWQRNRRRHVAPPEETDEVAALKKAIEKLPSGDIIVDAPPQMTVGETCVISVAITTESRDSVLASVAAANANLSTQRTKVGPSMRVQLVENTDAFKILPIGDVDRLFSGREAWSFNVRAERSGTKTLKVLVAVLIQLPGGAQREPFYATVTEIKIRVRISYCRIIGKWGWGAWLAAGAVAGYVASFDPVKQLLAGYFNTYIGGHIGVTLPTK